MARFKDGLGLGGGGPVRLSSALSPVTGEFFAIEADGAGDLTISTLVGLEGAGDSVWDGLVLAPGQALLAGEDVITSITITSGTGWAYRV